ncbi:MAG: hypothetical protein MZV63_29980 [Marinilabiliales bacterium]|nr:hypothetical protein [Marinilabiliales bacterium]
MLRQAQADGIVDRDITVAVRNGTGSDTCKCLKQARHQRTLFMMNQPRARPCYIEPAEVVELNNEITELEHQEKREIVRILTALADITQTLY